MLQAAASQWARMRLDVVCLQETHHTGEGQSRLLQRGLNAAAKRLGTPGWVIVAESFTPNPRTAGVAILVRSDLSQVVSPVEVPLRMKPEEAPPGRFLQYSFTWGGHRVHLANIYMPTAAYAAQRKDFIRKTLTPVYAAAREDDQLLWVGDFNFVADAGLDSTAGVGGRGADGSVANEFGTLCPGMVDTYRQLHPRRRDFSHLYRAPRPGASRLDRLYVSTCMLPYVVSSTIETSTPSDHRVAVITLLPRVAKGKGPGMPRVRTHFLAYEDLREQFVNWVQAEGSLRPGVADQPGLLAWWPTFKRRMGAIAGALNRQCRLRRMRPGVRLEVAVQAARAAFAAVEEGAAEGPHTWQGLVAAQEEVAAAARAVGAADARTARLEWLRDGERPSRGLTALVQPPRARQAVVALQDETGRLVTDAARLPQMVAEYWREVCRAPPHVSSEAREEVIAALRAQNLRIPEAQACCVGSPEILVAEVAAVLKAVTPGKSPGWDGIPSELYKACRTQIAPVLADVFTAVGQSGQVPPGFLDGVITILYKNRGALTAQGSYRPITLLCTDYRVLTKVLASRLGPVLGGVISLEQSAFLPKRLIGANVLFLRQIPHLMAQQGRSCVLAFLDIAKAYDSVDRCFLYEVMEAMGAGAGLMSWARILLTDTRSLAVVNGHKSRLVPIQAGVRQGCPLAPLLYLFVAQALLCWLQQRGVGIRLAVGAGPITTAVQFADDTQVLLEGPAEVPAFLASMEVYAQASGQRLNLDKVEMLSIGVEGPSPHDMGGLKVVASATALNLPFTDVGGSPMLDWETQRDKVLSRFSRIARLRLSTFGRATAAAAYGMHRVTWHMEHGGLPPDTVVEGLERVAAKLVDRDLAPDARERRATGVPQRLLVGHPSLGGFGAIALKEHVRARWAGWALRFILAMAGPRERRPPWVMCLNTYLRGVHPAFGPLNLLTAQGRGPWMGADEMPADIRRVITALAALPPVQDIGSEPLVPGPWCVNVPIWGNPLLPACQSGQMGVGRRPGLEYLHPELVGCWTIKTLGDVLTARDALRDFLAASESAVQTAWPARWRGLVVRVLDPRSTAAKTFLGLDRWRECMGALEAMLAEVPTPWKQAAARVMPVSSQSIPHAIPGMEEVGSMITARLGWRLGGGEPLALRDMTVRVGTAVQLVEFADARRAAHETFVREALGGTGPVLPAALNALQQVFRRLWSGLKWEPACKEGWWRLAVDGIPLLGNSHMRTAAAAPCGCGAPAGAAPGAGTPRLHHFWFCPVAQAVIAQLETQLGAGVTRAQVWLVQAPPGVQSCVWDVVVLAAITAMEVGRRFMAAALKRVAAGGPPLMPGSGLLDRAIRRGVVEFWALLRGFAALGLPQKGWDAVGPRHPFLRVVASSLVCGGPAEVLVDS